MTLSADSVAVAANRTGLGVVVDQGIAFSVWLGVAVLALIGAQVILWHTRRVLRRLRTDLGVPKGRLIPAAAAKVDASVIAA
jgi:hypothetical protein